jgi:FMN phosphatase YigB (HAD superfamily)
MMAGIKALLVDVDGTLIRLRADAHPAVRPTGDWSSSLLQVLQQAGTSLGGLTAEESARRMQKVQEEIHWWHISDFMSALNLSPVSFWPHALRVELEYLEATGPDILPALHRLRAGGMRIHITSNNPNDGIWHKLRLARLAETWDPPLFEHILGVAELQSMKWDAEYWRRVLDRIGLSGGEVAVVGDNPHDDYQVPLAAIGIAHSFILSRELDRTAENSDRLTFVSSFEDIADAVVGGKPQFRTVLSNEQVWPSANNPPLPQKYRCFEEQAVI